MEGVYTMSMKRHEGRLSDADLPTAKINACIDVRDVFETEQLSLSRSNESVISAEHFLSSLPFLYHPRGSEARGSPAQTTPC